MKAEISGRKSPICIQNGNQPVEQVDFPTSKTVSEDINSCRLPNGNYWTSVNFHQNLKAIVSEQQSLLLHVEIKCWKCWNWRGIFE